MNPIVKHVRGHVFDVVDGANGQVLEAGIISRVKAEQVAEAMAVKAARKAGMRPCMCCAMQFESEGIHNRLCQSCCTRGYAAGAL